MPETASKTVPKRKAPKDSKPSAGKFERLPTGIPGLDKLIEGGFVRGSTTLLAGGTGTGKTLFCVQFIMEGLKRGEKCMFITLEETTEDIIGDCASLGWDLSKYIEKGQLELVYKDPFGLTNAARTLPGFVSKGLQRVVIDSISVLGLYFKYPFEIRKNLFMTLNALKKTGATVLVTAEAPEDGKMLTRFGVEEFVTDGVITLHYLGLGGTNYHSLQIRKMRRTNHGKDVYAMEIGKNGIVIKQQGA